jgi:hypothetical protein
MNTVQVGKQSTIGWQLNLMHCKVAVANLVQQLSSEGNPVITLVQEPHVSGKGKIVGIPSNIKVMAAGLKPRAAILTKDVDLWLCDSFSDRDVTTCLGKIGNKETYICSLYLDGTKMTFPEKFLNLLASRGDRSILIGIDTNSHSTLWGCDNTDARGSWLEDLVFLHGLTVLNTGNTSTFINSRSPQGTLIDITVSSPDLFEWIAKWNVNTDHQFSDHRRIEFEFKSALPRKPRTWCFKKARWAKFNEKVEDLSKKWLKPIYWTPETVDRAVTNLTSDIKRALQVSCPRTSPGDKVYKPKEVTWLSAELNELCNVVRKVERTARLQADTATWDRFRCKRREFTNSIRRAKRASWKQFTSECSNTSRMAKLARSIFCGPQREIGILKNPHGGYTNSPEEVLNLLMDTFFPDSSGVKVPTMPAKVFLNDNNLESVIIKPTKVEAAFKSFGKYKSAGPDGLQPVVLHNIGQETILRITQIYRASLSLGYVLCTLDMAEKSSHLYSQSGKG